MNLIFLFFLSANLASAQETGVNTYYVTPENIVCKSRDIELRIQAREIGDLEGRSKVSAKFSYKGIVATIENRGLEKTHEIMHHHAMISGVVSSGRALFGVVTSDITLNATDNAFHPFTKFSLLQKAGPISFPAKSRFMKLQSGFRRMVPTDIDFKVSCVVAGFLPKCKVDVESMGKIFCSE